MSKCNSHFCIGLALLSAGPFLLQARCCRLLLGTQALLLQLQKRLEMGKNAVLEQMLVRRTGAPPQKPQPDALIKAVAKRAGAQPAVTTPTTATVPCYMTPLDRSRRRSFELRRRRASLTPEDAERLLRNRDKVLGAALSMHVIHDVPLDVVGERLAASGVRPELRDEALAAIRESLEEQAERFIKTTRVKEARKTVRKKKQDVEDELVADIVAAKEERRPSPPPPPPPPKHEPEPEPEPVPKAKAKAKPKPRKPRAKPVPKPVAPSLTFL